MKTITAIAISLFLALTAAPAANAQAVDSATNKLNAIGGITGLGSVDVSSDAGLYEKIAAIINILLGFAGVIATILIIVAGTRWILSGGNEEEITKAKNIIKGAVIGILIVLGAYVVVNFVAEELIGIFTS